MCIWEPDLFVEGKIAEHTGQDFVTEAALPQR